MHSRKQRDFGAVNTSLVAAYLQAQASAELTHSKKGAELKQELRSALQPVQSCGLYGLKVNGISSLARLLQYRLKGS